MKPLSSVHCTFNLQWDSALKDSPLKHSMSGQRIKSCLQEALAVAQCDLPGEINVRIVDASEALELNRIYRHKAYATNVLTFAYESDPELMADLVLCAPVLEKEAIELNRPLADHFAHLLVHGCLHALGFDHEEDEWMALQMEALEVMALDNLKVPNPYQA
jgi:probable rRNA maturation factor